MTHNNPRIASTHGGTFRYPDAEAHYNLGTALAQTGRMQEAREHFEQALRFNPDDAEAHHNYGVVLQRLGRVPEAIAHYEEALRIKPDFAEAHYGLAIALAQAGKTHGSDRAFAAGAAAQARLRRGALRLGDGFGASG